MKKWIILYCITLLGFLLGIHNGQIALWEDGKTEPVKVFPYRAEMLPAKDRQRLEKGIRFESKQDLMERMEDYLS